VEIHVSSVQKFPDEIEESLVLDLLSQRRYQNMMIQFVERSYN